MNKDKYAMLTDLMCRVLSCMDEYGEDVSVSAYEYSGKKAVTVKIGGDEIEYKFCKDI